MPDKYLNENPLPVNTEKGVSVYYKERFLYSKKNPCRVINSLIHSLVIHNKTLVLCASPVLGYGLHEIINKLPADSFILILERDKKLGFFFEQNFWNSFKIGLTKENIFYICSDDIKIILKNIEEKTKYAFTKVLKLECSGGYRLYENFYNGIAEHIQKTCSIFWKNRITLMALGRSYARNIFKNYCKVKEKNGKYKMLNSAFNAKPVFVAGAGPSLDEAIPFINKHRKDIFLLAVDAALSALMPDILPDAVVVLETQFWIQKAFIGAAGTKIPVFADITANHNAISAAGGDVFFFYTEYTQSVFFKRFSEKNILPQSFLPLGSVGLTTLQLAIRISKNNTPIFHSGLDFSWSNGFTHAKKSAQSLLLFSVINKTDSFYEANIIFPNRCTHVKGKYEKEFYTTPNMLSYAETYKKFFGNNENIFDLGSQGLNISHRNICTDIAVKIINLYKTFTSKSYENKQYGIPFDFHKIKDTFQSEKEFLLTLKKILTGKKKFDKNEVLNILKACDYLYLHFPDAVEPDLLNTNFLKRVRIELEYFIKILSD